MAECSEKRLSQEHLAEDQMRVSLTLLESVYLMMMMTMNRYLIYKAEKSISDEHKARQQCMYVVCRVADYCVCCSASVVPHISLSRVDCVGLPEDQQGDGVQSFLLSLSTRKDKESDNMTAEMLFEKIQHQSMFCSDVL